MPVREAYRALSDRAHRRFSLRRRKLSQRRSAKPAVRAGLSALLSGASDDGRALRRRNHHAFSMGFDRRRRRQPDGRTMRLGRPRAPRKRDPVGRRQRDLRLVQRHAERSGRNVRPSRRRARSDCRQLHAPLPLHRNCVSATSELCRRPSPACHFFSLSPGRASRAFRRRRSRPCAAASRR